MSSPASFVPANNNKQKLPAVLATAPTSSTFARWDDPLGRYAHTYVTQAETLLLRLKSIAGAINEQLQNQEKLKKEEEDRYEKSRYSSPPKNSNNNNTHNVAPPPLDFSHETASMIFPNTTKLDLLIARLDQQVLVGNRLRKIIEHYSVQPNERMASSVSSSSSMNRAGGKPGSPTSATTNSVATIVGGVAWCAVAGQVKAALAGFLQQLRLDMLCALSVLMEAERRKAQIISGDFKPKNNNTNNGGEPQESTLLVTSFAIDHDPAEAIVGDVAKSLFTINNEVYRLVNEVAGPLVEKASTSVSSVMESMMTFASPSSASLRSGNQNATSAVGGGALSSAKRSNYGGGSEAGGSSSAYTTTTKQNATTVAGNNNNKNQTVVTLNSSCPEYLNCLSQSSDPVITALSVACRGHEHLHRTHIDMLRGLMSNVVLGLIRRHSLLTGAVRMIRDISQKYHRIVEGQTALRTIRKSVSLAMSPEDRMPEPADALLEVDALGRLLQEVMATATVMKETCTVLRHWAFETSSTANTSNTTETPPGSSPNAFPVSPATTTSATTVGRTQRHAFDNPSQVRTAMAQHHTKSNGQYLLTTLRSMISLLRRIAVAADKTLTAWSEPALNAFGKILEVHSAPLLQCARVIANAQTDMKQLIGLCREKAVMVEESRAIEDTIAVLGSATTSNLIYSSLDQQLREIETLSRTIHSFATRSTAILNDVVTTLCKPISQFSQHLPFQFVDNEDETLTSSLQQLCKQHDTILENLKATTSTSSNNSGNGTTATASLSLQEMTTSMSSAKLLNESEQRAVAASCSFERLNSICNEIDGQCDRWFKNRFTSNSKNTNQRKPLQYNYGDGNNNNNNNNKKNMMGNALEDDEALLDEEALETASPSALLSISVRNEDRLLAMNVLRGTMRHLQAGEESFLVVPRPDTVSSPSALNDFEDEFSVAFVGVEGLCEQVFSSHNALGLPQIAIASASSLDVLAKVGALAANQNNTNNNHNNNTNMMMRNQSGNNNNSNNVGGGASRMSGGTPYQQQQQNQNRSHHVRSNSGTSSLGGVSFDHQNQHGGGPFISVTADTNENNFAVNNNSFFGRGNSPMSLMTPTNSNVNNYNNNLSPGNNYLSSSTMTTPPAAAVSHAPVTSRSGRNRSYTTIVVNPAVNNNSNSQQDQHQMSEPKTFLSTNFANSASSGANANSNATNFSTASRLLQSPGNNNSSRLRSGAVNVRSFTYQAAMAMPEHEMVPPEM